MKKQTNRHETNKEGKTDRQTDRIEFKGEGEGDKDFKEKAEKPLSQVRQTTQADSAKPDKLIMHSLTLGKLSG